MVNKLEHKLERLVFSLFLSVVSIFLVFANEYFLRLQITIVITFGSVVTSLLLMSLISFLAMKQQNSLLMTYVVVILSIVVQGSTIGPMIERSIQASNEKSPYIKGFV